jgi:hypothetical protein
VDNEDLAKMYVIETKVVTLSLGGQGGKKGEIKMKPLPRTYMKTMEI